MIGQYVNSSGKLQSDDQFSESGKRFYGWQVTRAEISEWLVKSNQTHVIREFMKTKFVEQRVTREFR